MIKTKRSAKIVITLMTLMMLLSAMAISVSADSRDGTFSYMFNGSTARTEPRLKEDRSSIYMYSATADISYIASAVGTNNGVEYSDCSCTSRYTYTFNKGDKRFMYNSVNEDGFSYAAVSAGASTHGYAVGAWSPDSVPQSGVLPPSDYNKE